MPANLSRKLKIGLLSVIALTVIFSLSVEEKASAQSIETLQVTYIDVGQGDSSLISTSTGTDILIDAGPQSAGAAVLSLLNAKGISELDVIVISHNHADHLGGLVDILQSPIAVGAILYNGNTCTTLICQEVWEEIGKRGITPQAVDSGDSYAWGSVTSAILNPQSTATGDENEDSIVMHVDFYEADLLYTGDIGFSTETILVNAGVLSPVEVLKVAHHGSAYSTSTTFLSAVIPQDSVISVGANSYGHPSDETLSRLLTSGTTLHRTDQDGNVSFMFYSGASDPEANTIYLPIIMLGARN